MWLMKRYPHLKEMNQEEIERIFHTLMKERAEDIVRRETEILEGEEEENPFGSKIH